MDTPGDRDDLWLFTGRQEALRAANRWLVGTGPPTHLGRRHRHPHRQPLTDHTGPVNAAAIGQLDGRTVIATGSDDLTVRIWHPTRVPTVETRATMSINVAEAVYGIAVHPPGIVAISTTLGVISLRLERR